MLESLLGFSVSGVIGVIGALAAIVSLITEVLKKIVPQSFPTKALVMIVSLILTIGFVLVFCAVSVKMVCMGIVGSFVVAYISMYGWDTFKELVNRFKAPKGVEGEVNGGDNTD